MPVQVAMALSGIDRDQWGDFKDLYDYGAKAMNQQLPRRSRSRASNSTSSSRGSSPGSKESGIGSMAANSPIPLTLRDYCMFKVEAMQCGAKNALDIIEMFDTAGKEPIEIKEKEKQPEPYPICTSELMWTGRNLLDLCSNLTYNTNMFQPAKLPEGVQSYFENRSQISRVSGAATPPHKIQNCSVSNCDFEEPQYYE